jgi:threonine dehydrogenase-like Zn-dependent dehydrogenase
VRALRFDGSTLSLDRAHRDPVAAAGEAIVRPTLTGVCATDVEIARGGTSFVGILGHEFVGVVEEINPAGLGTAQAERAKRLKGKRVVGSINIVCGKCDLCRAGLSTHCRSRTVLGCAGRDGCFADRFALPLANLHAVPESVEDERAVFAEPLAAAAHAANMVRVEGKPYITVLGDGKLGLLCVQVMARLNASVRLLGKHPAKFGLCDRWGIKHRHIDEVGRRQDQDIVVDCTGSASGLALAMQLVRPRGKVIIKSTVSPLPMPPGAPVPGANHPAWSSPLNLAPIVINEIELVGSRCGSISDALALLEQHSVHTEALVTARGKLDDGPELVNAASQKGQLKVLMSV